MLETPLDQVEPYGIFKDTLISTVQYFEVMEDPG